MTPKCHDLGQWSFQDLYKEMCDRVDQLALFPYNRGWLHQHKSVGVYRAPWNKDSVIKGGMSLSPKKKATTLTMAQIPCFFCEIAIWVHFPSKFSVPQLLQNIKQFWASSLILKFSWHWQPKIGAVPSLKLTAKAPENGWLEDEFPFGMA